MRMSKFVNLTLLALMSTPNFVQENNAKAGNFILTNSLFREKGLCVIAFYFESDQRFNFY